MLKWIFGWSCGKRERAVDEPRDRRPTVQPQTAPPEPWFHPLPILECILADRVAVGLSRGDVLGGLLGDAMNSSDDQTTRHEATPEVSSPNDFDGQSSTDPGSSGNFDSPGDYDSGASFDFGPTGGSD